MSAKICFHGKRQKTITKNTTFTLVAVNTLSNQIFLIKKSMILVTGGTGLVGSHLLYDLVKSRQKVRAIYRRKHKLDAVKHVFSYYSKNPDELFNSIEWIEADITDIPALKDAFQNIEYVYHCAAFISFEPDKYRLLRKINIEGTANIVNLSINQGVKKLCYVSSIATIGHHNHPDKLITENTHWNPEDDNNVYAITKYGAELEVWRGSQEGMDVVVVNPGIIIGPGFWHGGGSGSLFKQIYKGLKYYTIGGSGYVSVYDVVALMMRLMESPVKNHGFIVVSENMTFKAFNEKVAAFLGVKPATKHVSFWKLQLAWRLDWLSHKLFRKRRRLSKQLAKTLVTETNYDNNKIKEALDFEFSSIDASIEKVTTFFLEDLKTKT